MDLTYFDKPSGNLTCKVIVEGDVELRYKVKRILSSYCSVLNNLYENPDVVVFVFKSDSKLDLLRSENFNGAPGFVYLSIYDIDDDFIMIDFEEGVPLVTFSEHRLEYYSSVLANTVQLVLKKRLRSNPAGIPKCPDYSTERSVLPPLLGKEGLTDFPKKGMNEEICFENSQFELFPIDEAIRLAKQFPKQWCSGGNHFGNKAFNYWIRTDRAYKEGRDIPKDCQRWIKKREGYIARHVNDYRLAGVVAMIKWAGFINGENGNGAVDGSSLDFMIDVVEGKVK